MEAGLVRDASLGREFVQIACIGPEAAAYLACPPTCALAYMNNMTLCLHVICASAWRLRMLFLLMCWCSDVGNLYRGDVGKRQHTNLAAAGIAGRLGALGPSARSSLDTSRLRRTALCSGSSAMHLQCWSRLYNAPASMVAWVRDRSYRAIKRCLDATGCRSHAAPNTLVHSICPTALLPWFTAGSSRVGYKHGGSRKNNRQDKDVTSRVLSLLLLFVPGLLERPAAPL